MQQNYFYNVTAMGKIIAERNAVIAIPMPVPVGNQNVYCPYLKIVLTGISIALVGISTEATRHYYSRS